ncbi:MAG: hypothetical protein FWH05_03750 [Oscillospiraceae bacterium]|nr:hypothetical protein [Oscillospiraceae bacterium]
MKQFKKTIKTNPDGTVPLGGSAIKTPPELTKRIERFLQSRKEHGFDKPISPQ